MPTPTPRPLVLDVATLTYRRPEHLAALVPLLIAQAQAVSSDDVLARVLVVDNDPEGGAADQVRAFAADSAIPLRYVHQPTPGIAAARNAALDAAADADLLASIDDDERPEPGWLAALLATHGVDEPAIVLGAVVAVFSEPPPAWVVEAEYWSRRRLPTGTEVAVGDTGNLLYDLRQIRAMGLRFDETLGLSGGEDNLFTMGVVTAGGRLVWCDEAVVLDPVAPERTTWRWLSQRRRTMAATRVSIGLRQVEGARARGRVRARFAASAAKEFGHGSSLLVVGVASRSSAKRAWGVRRLVRASGLSAGVVGYTGEQYKRPASAEPTVRTSRSIKRRAAQARRTSRS